MITQNSQNSHNFFYCEKCDYECCRKSDYNKHILTSKHQNDDAQLPKTLKTLKKYNCSCGKEYRYRQGLYLHRKKCSKYENIEEPENIAILENTDKKDELINYLIKENQEFKNLILEIVKKDTITNNNITSNSHNKTFNLNVFLNETCKDAMNIMDFVDSIKIQLTDIESIGELGFVNGMSKLIIKNLNALAENMRPVHCSDPKRESLYVKDSNVWEKEDSENKKIKKAIKYISHKNICAIPEWKAKYPDCIYSDSKKSDQYNHIIIESMGGSGDNDIEKADKIVKKIAKEVTIDKNN
jgi:hypothetical protein